MTKLHRWALLAVISLGAGLAISVALAQPGDDPQAKPQHSGPRVAVLDLAQVFAKHTRFQGALAEMKADAARAEARVRQETETLRKLAEDLKKSSKDPQSPEYKAAEEDLAKRGKDLQVRVELDRKQLLQREGLLYYQEYQQVLRVVQDFAKANGIEVVLRFHRGAVDTTKPNAVLQHINRAIVWTDERLDVTPVILEQLNRPSGKPKPMAADQPGSEGKVKAVAAAEVRKPVPNDAKKAAERRKPPSDAKKAAEPRKPPSDAKKAAAAKPKPPPKLPALSTPTVARFTLRGTYPEGPSSPGLFGDSRPSLATAVGRMEQATEDDDVAAVVLRIQGADLGRAKLHELRAAVARLRKAGKPVYAELTSADASQYVLAAACDEIVMAPIGSLIIPGVRAEATFFKGLLDKLGIQFDVLEMGKYKGAAESFTRTGMSPPVRESLEALVDDTYEHLVAQVAEDRKLEPARVKALIDRGIFTAEAARKAELVDHVMYPDEFRATLVKRLGTGAVKLVDDYRQKKKPEADLSGLAGMMKVMQMMFSAEPPTKTSKKQKIAVVYAVGTIVPGRSASGLFGEQAVGSTTLVKALRAARDDPRVLAIVLRIDSPGGSAVAADMIWREIVKINKPIIASMGDVAGSGGYYIAMGADKILAAPDTVTGSIGVVGGKFVLGGLYEKIGITTEVISRGKNSGAFSSTRSFTAEERKAWMAVMEDVYRQFVAKAAQGRKMPSEKLEALAQGRVYNGRMAAANGLIDGLGTLEDAVAEAKQAAGLEADQQIELLILPRPRGFFEQLLEEPFLSTALEAAAPELKKTLPDLQVIRRLFSEPALALMPCWLKLK